MEDQQNQFLSDDPTEDADQQNIQAKVSAILEDTLDESLLKERKPLPINSSITLGPETDKVVNGVDKELPNVTPRKDVDEPSCDNDNELNKSMEAPKLDNFAGDYASNSDTEGANLNESRSPPKLPQENGFPQTKVDNGTKNNLSVSKFNVSPRGSPRKATQKSSIQTDLPTSMSETVLKKMPEKKKSLSPVKTKADKTSRSISSHQTDEGISAAKVTAPPALVGWKRAPHKDDNGELSLFLPEGWQFLASKRQIGTNVGHFDIYYMTPPPDQRKLRSRSELKNYMEKHQLTFDPLLFFRKHEIQPLLKSGVLKYHGSESKYVVHSSYDENCSFPVIPTKLKRSFVEYISRKADRTAIKSEKMKKYRESVGNKPEETVKKSEGIKNNYGRKKREETVKKSDISGAPAKKKRITTVRSTINKRMRKKRAQKQAFHIARNPVKRDTRSMIEMLTSSVETQDTSEKLKETNESSLPVKPRRGRPPKAKKLVSSAVVKTEVEVSPPRSDITLEERVKILPKPKLFKSPYFTSSLTCLGPPKSLAGIRREKNNSDTPPRSPYNLIQEDLFHDPWQLLIATIFLNSTSGKVAIPLALEFLKRWPTPQEACQAKLYDILDVIEPLGFGRTRAAIIIRFSHEFLTKDWRLPSELYGIGKYGTDSYKIFCMKNEWKKVDSDDPMLMMYLNWRRATEHLRKKFLNSAEDSTQVDPDDIFCISEKTSSKSVKNATTLPSSNPNHSKRKSSKISSSSNDNVPRKRLRTRTVL